MKNKNMLLIPELTDINWKQQLKIKSFRPSIDMFSWFENEVMETEHKLSQKLTPIKRKHERSCEVPPKVLQIVPAQKIERSTSISPIKIRKTIFFKRQKQTQYIFDLLTIIQLILTVNRVKLLPYPSSYFIYFNVYIEDGNNSQMIKNIIRRRSGWKVVQSPSVANFIWSQHYKYDCKPIKKLKIRSQNQMMKINQSFMKKRQSISQLQYQKQIKKICPFDQHLPQKQFINLQLGPNLHIYNHFPNHYCMSDKKNLIKYITNDIPFSMEANAQTNLQELRQKLMEFGNIWLIKPAQNSNRGRGIVVYRQIDDVINEMERRYHPQEQQKKYKKSILIQQYIEPFLYNQRKIDLRMFMLITFVRGKVRGYLYEDGYVRTSSKMFSLQSSDRFIHLTNDAVQFECTDYGRYEEGNKLSWKKFQSMFKEWSVMNQQLKNISKNILISCKSQLIKKSSKKRKNQRIFSQNQYLEEDNIYFQIFGLDFLVDYNNKVWLIEVNTNPSLNTDNSRVVRSLIPKMIENAFDIAVEPFSRINRLGEGHKYQNHFQTIFDDEY